MYITKAEGALIQQLDAKRAAQKNKITNGNSEEFETLIADAVELSDPNNKKEQSRKKEKNGLNDRIEAHSENSDNRDGTSNELDKTANPSSSLDISV